MTTAKLAFGEFELDLEQRSLHRRGEPISLQPRTLDLLAHLARHPGETLSRAQLLARVWGDVHVSDGALSTAVYEVRKALGDADREPPWLRTVRGRGFCFEAPVRKLRPPPPQTRPAPYFGRTELLSDLTSALADARAGRGQVVLLEGDAGMGKTRTTVEILRSADGCQVAQGWCDERRSVPAFWPWTQVLRELLPVELSDSAAEVLGLRPGSHAPRELAWHEPLAASRIGVLDSLTTALRRACERSPLVVVLEDLHDADGPSVAALEFVARRMADWPMLLVATYRPNQLEDLGRTIGGIVSFPHTRQFELEPLDAPQVIGLVRHALGRKATQRVCQAIFQRSGGNPFFVRALAREVDAHEGAEAELPRSIRAVLDRRLDRLRPATREAVRVAAVVGSTFEVNLVERIVGKLDPDWHDEAVTVGVLEQASGSPLHFRFRHTLFRDAAEGEVAPGERARLHQRIAELKLERDGDPAGRELAEIAHHLAGALAIADDDGAEALRFSRAAAEEALRASAWESCEAHAGVALGILRSSPLPEDPPSLLGVMALHCVALNSLGGRQKEMAKHLDEAAVLLDRIDDDELRAVFAGLRYVHERNLGHYDLAIRGVEELPAAHAGSAVLGRLWRGTLHALGGEFESARDEIDEEPPPADARPAFAHYLVLDPAVVALASSAVACLGLGEERSALRRIDRAVQLAEDERAPYSMAMAQFIACILHDLRGDLESLTATAAALDAVATNHGIAPFLGSGFMFGAWADELRGHPRLPIADLGSIVAPRFDRPEGGGSRGYAQHLVAMFFERGDRLDAAQQHAEAARDWSEQHAERWVLCETWRLLGRLALAGGRRGEARDAWIAARDLARRQASPVFELRALLDLHALEGDAVVAREAAELLAAPRELPTRDRAAALRQLGS